MSSKSKDDGAGRLVSIAVLCLLVGSIVASYFQGEHTLSGKLAPRVVAPVVAGDASRAGQQIDLQALRGKVVLLDFWATWCPPCRASIPVLARLAHRYRDRGVEVIGVDTESNLDPSSLASAFDRLGGTFASIQDRDGSLVEAYGVKNLPTLFVVDQAGVIRKVHVGAADEELLEREITNLIN